MVPHGKIRGPLGAEQADLKVKLGRQRCPRKSEVWAGPGAGVAAVPGPWPCVRGDCGSALARQPWVRGMGLTAWFSN